MTTRPLPAHGDHRCYRRGCRREECRTADRNQRKRGQLRRNNGHPGRINSTPVANHINTLINAGWTQLDIAARSGVSDRIIGYIHAGQPTVQHGTAARILSLTPDPIVRRVDATGTRRRIQALAAIGWPITYTAKTAGYSHRLVFCILNGSRPDIEPWVAKQTAAVYRTHVLRPGPSEFTRAIARRNGWHGPLAWDDIDNPHAQPEVFDAPEPVRTRAEQIAEDARWLLRAGHDPDHIAERLGVTRSYMNKALRATTTHTQERTAA